MNANCKVYLLQSRYETDRKPLCTDRAARLTAGQKCSTAVVLLQEAMSNVHHTVRLSSWQRQQIRFTNARSHYVLLQQKRAVVSISPQCVKTTPVRVRLEGFYVMNLHHMKTSFMKRTSQCRSQKLENWKTAASQHELQTGK